MLALLSVSFYFNKVVMVSLKRLLNFPKGECRRFLNPGVWG